MCVCLWLRVRTALRVRHFTIFVFLCSPHHPIRTRFVITCPWIGISSKSLVPKKSRAKVPSGASIPRRNPSWPNRRFAVDVSAAPTASDLPMETCHQGIFDETVMILISLLHYSLPSWPWICGHLRKEINKKKFWTKSLRWITKMLLFETIKISL